MDSCMKPSKHCLLREFCRIRMWKAGDMRILDGPYVPL